MEVFPLKVNIGLRANGHADHPDWTKLPLALSGDPERDMIHGWVYDKTSGHREESLDSPYGMQWGVLLVTRQFAGEALAAFPATITLLTEAELAIFWDEKAHAHLPSNRTDTDALLALRAERDLLVDLGRPTTKIDVEISKALDPDDPTPGKRKEHMKTWVDAKAKIGATVGTIP